MANVPGKLAEFVVAGSSAIWPASGLKGCGLGRVRHSPV